MKNDNFEQFVEVFTQLCTNYTKYVDAKVQASSQIITMMPTHVLVDDVRTVNVLAVTLGRLKALEKEQQFEANSGI